MKFLQSVLLILIIGIYGFAAEPATASKNKEEPVNGPVVDGQEDKFQKRSIRIFGFTVLMGIICYGYVGWNRKKGDSKDSSIRVVSVKPLGQREKVAVLEVFGEKIVVGVTAHHVSLLRHTSSAVIEESREVRPKE